MIWCRTSHFGIKYPLAQEGKEKVREIKTRGSEEEKSIMGNNRSGREE